MSIPNHNFHLSGKLQDSYGSLEAIKHSSLSNAESGPMMIDQFYFLHLRSM